jgi:hypothetical protein
VTAPRPFTLADQMAAMRTRHHTVARRYAAEVERHARQITLDLARGQSVTDLIQRMNEYLHRLQGEQRAIDVIDEWASRMRQAAQVRQPAA